MDNFIRAHPKRRRGAEKRIHIRWKAPMGILWITVLRGQKTEGGAQGIGMPHRQDPRDQPRPSPPGRDTRGFSPFHPGVIPGLSTGEMPPKCRRGKGFGSYPPYPPPLLRLRYIYIQLPRWSKDVSICIFWSTLLISTRA